MQRAFTLIELMIVVAILGILAAIAIPNYTMFVCKNKQIEAKVNLKALYTAQESYRAEFGSYLTSCGGNCMLPNPVGFLKVGKNRYSYDDTATLTPAFMDAEALGNANQGVGADEWHMTSDNAIFHTVDGCN